MKQLPCIKQHVLGKWLEIRNKKDQRFNRHDFRRQFLTWPTRLERLTINAIACLLTRVS